MKSGEINENWYSYHWFLPDVLTGFFWQNLLFLYLIAAVPFVFFLSWLFHIRFRRRLELAFSPGEFLNFRNTIVRHIPAILFGISISMILLALARPQIIETSKSSLSEGIDILLVLDISESMEIQDIKPNRLKASVQVANKFIQNRPFDNIGLVVFSSSALSISPLTYDHEALQYWLKELRTNMLEGGGTAIGDAIATGINRLRDSKASSKALILISDGENTAGKIDPISAARLASAFDIHIYSIAIGKEGKVPIRDKKTGDISYVESSLDEKTLTRVADLTAGKFFRAKDGYQLKEVFEEIDQLEKYQYQTSSSTEAHDYYQIYLHWALVFFLLWLFTKNTFLTNGLVD